MAHGILSLSGPQLRRILLILFRLPEQDVPVVQLSLLKGLNPEEHIKIGEALRPLLNEESLLVGDAVSILNSSGCWQWFNIAQLSSQLERRNPGPMDRCF